MKPHWKKRRDEDVLTRTSKVRYWIDVASARRKVERLNRDAAVLRPVDLVPRLRKKVDP